MMTSKVLSTMTLAGILLISVTSLAGGIKARMLARIPVIMELKAKGIIGENNNGYLKFRSANREEADVVDAENRDRKTVYEQIAGNQGTTSEVVGKLRAVQIKKKAKPGEWLQDGTGKWHQKR